MHIWTIENWIKFYKEGSVRTGLRIRFDKNVDHEVKRACKEFCKFLRQNYYFPIRIPIYVKSAYRIKAHDGDLVCGTFFGPKLRTVEPYIRIAAGDFDDLKNKKGQDNALASILSSIAHELTHYFQWINDIKLTEMGYERQANAYSGYLLDEYAETREHP